MEKIKQALDRARDTRKSESRSYIHRSRAHVSPKPEISQEIKYTKTKFVEVSWDKLREKRVIVGDTNDSISDQYKVLRTHILQRMKANQWNLLAITSPSEGCGKTLTSINLAISLAREVNHTVLLVDLDLRRPSIQSYFFKDEHPGISDYLTEGKELSEILFNPGLQRMLILPGNRSFTNSSEMLSSPKMVQLVEELKTRYQNRIVIFDMPPVLSCDDTMAFSPYIDAIMLVVEEGGTHKNDLKQAYDLLPNEKIIGTLLNKSRVSNTKYGYY